MSLRYRPEIDGLRTIAVGAVLIYHAKFEDGAVLPGGFLGVDVFFVISGFLITSLILKERAETGRFSVARFYERRARRLLPALLVVILCSLPFAWTILMPTQMETFARSLLASVFFVSNHFWHLASQVYGAEDGLLRPFLHTWSLAVEEQFYIFFPLLLLLVLRFLPRLALAVGILGIAGGLAFAELMTARDPGLSFYWLPSRVWELLAGAVLAHLLFRRPGFGRRPMPMQVMPSLGLALIVAPMVLLPLGQHHPGIATLPAVLGSVLVIWFAGGGDAATRMLASRPFVWIGLISYGLYLWHYPIFAFARLVDADPGALQKVGWIVLSIALAAISYRLVERPFRRPATMPLSRVVPVLGAATVMICAFSVTMLATDGMRARLPQLIALYGPNEFDNEILRDESWAVLNDLAAALGLDESQAHRPSDFEMHELWFDPEGGRKKILVVGNSHAKDMFNALYLAGEDLPGIETARFGMGAGLPAGQVDALLASPNYRAADLILFSFRYGKSSIERLPQVLERLSRDGKPIALLTNTVEFEPIEGLPVFDWYLRQNGGEIDREALGQLAWVSRSDEQDRLNDELVRIAAEAGVPLLRKSDLLCPPGRETCAVVTDDGMKVLFDYGHWTTQGARFLGRRIVDTGWLESAGAF